jgi:hypothetical protein
MVDARLAVIATLDDILATPNLPEANTGLPFLLNRSGNESSAGPAHVLQPEGGGRDRPLKGGKASAGFGRTGCKPMNRLNRPAFKPKEPSGESGQHRGWACGSRGVSHHPG